jgi:chromosomal replication initiation ATPase DnaA
LRVGPEVVSYLVARIERSFDAIAATVAALDRLALAERRDITVPLAREALDGQLPLGL